MNAPLLLWLFMDIPLCTHTIVQRKSWYSAHLSTIHSTADLKIVWGFIWVYFSSIEWKTEGSKPFYQNSASRWKKNVAHLFYQKRLKFWQEIENTPEFFKNVSRILITTSCLSWILPCIYAVLSMHLYFFFLWAKVNSRGT